MTRVYGCAGCGWRGLAGPPGSAPPAVCGRCGEAGLAVSSERHPRITRRCACGAEFLSTSPRPDPQCAPCRGLAASRRERGKRLKYEWTPERDAVLRRRYDSRVRGRSRELARIWGWPVWVLKRRARQLGLSRPTNRRNFTPTETAFVEEWTGARTSKWIAQQLGRSETSVILKQHRMQLSRRVRDGYTVAEVSACFGVDHHAVDRWIAKDWLRAERRGTDRPRDIWRTTEQAIRKFMRNHPTAFRLDRCDQAWALDLLLGAPFVEDQLRRHTDRNEAA